MRLARLFKAAKERRATNATASNGRGLVVVKNALVEQAFKALSLNIRKGRKSSYGRLDAAGLRNGMAAGDRATFSRPVNGGGARPLAIGRM